MVDTLSASPQGLAIADQARRRLGWTKTSTARWWQDAHTSRATLRRFWRGENIQQEAFIAICKAVGITDWSQIAADSVTAGATDPAPVGETPPLVDWDEAPDLNAFCGRSQELQHLETLILSDRQRFIAITGLAGVGKTALALACADRLQEKFAGVIWRSLWHHASLADLLDSLLTAFGEPPPPDQRSVAPLSAHLKRHRYLIVLDGLDNALDSEVLDGVAARDTWQAWANLSRLSQMNYQSCILTTSREPPPLANLPPAAQMPLTGLSQADGETLLATLGLTGSFAERSALSRIYGGNPLAMLLAVPVIQSLFGGHLGQFLQQKALFVGDRLRTLLDQQLAHLTPLEKAIAYWLAIWQEPIALSRLQSHLLPTPDPLRVLECLVNLEGRSLLSKCFIEDEPAFTLHPLVMECVIAQVVQIVGAEIEQILDSQDIGKMQVLRTHCLVRPGTDDVAGDRLLRQIQGNLCQRYGVKVGDRLWDLQTLLQGHASVTLGYAGYNLTELGRAWMD
ncbi:MAG: ATP-binding protein [Synechococcales bacterium]|nr:ATP-binding protein [Synechococcales bacterium]